MLRKLKCFFGWHWWLTPYGQDYERIRYANNGKVKEVRIYGWCQKQKY